MLSSSTIVVSNVEMLLSYTISVNTIGIEHGISIGKATKKFVLN